MIRDLAKTFREEGRGVPAVDDVSFEVYDKEFVALGIKQVETRLLRWRPEYRTRA